MIIQGARASYGDAVRAQQHIRRSPRLRASMTEAFTDLSEACRSWMQALLWLEDATVTTQEPQAQIADLTVQVGTHQQQLFRLFTRMLEEVSARSDDPLRVLVGTLALPAEEVS